MKEDIQIIKCRTEALDLKFGGKYNGGLIFSKSFAAIKIVNVKEDNITIIYCDFKTEIRADEFKLVAHIIIPFELHHKSKLNENILYECIKISRNYLQEIVDLSFQLSSKLPVSEVPFDSVYNTLAELLKTFYQ